MVIFNFSKYPNKFFVETGTYRGDSLFHALTSGSFDQLFSVEIQSGLYEHCKRRFADQENVKVFHGDTIDILPQILEKIDAPATFWLDGHYTGVYAGSGSIKCPLLLELEIIKKHPIKTHTLLIDDVPSFGTEDFSYVTKEQIIEKLFAINPHYHLSIQDRGTCPNQVLVASIE